METIFQTITNQTMLYTCSIRITVASKTPRLLKKTIFTQAIFIYIYTSSLRQSDLCPWHEKCVYGLTLWFGSTSTH